MPKPRIIYDIGFNVDGTGLQKLKSQLNDIRKFSISDFQIFNPKATTQELQLMEANVKETANRIEVALEKSFNPKINSISLHKFREELKDLPLSEIANNFKKAGDAGQEAFSKLTNVLMSTKQQLKETSNWADKLGETLANTVRWKVASSAIDTFTGGIQKAWGFAQKLDTSLNDIRIVTEKSNEEMEKFAKNANKAAKSLGTSTTSYTNASLIYYQQGLSDKDVRARTDVTVKAANVTGQSASEVSEQLTAVWNGYKVVAEEAELYVDKLAAVAASTAADLEELSTGMSKVASAANAMGVDVDQLSAQLSTIISVTRQDASVVGTALKTIYSRMGDLKVDGVDEFGTSLGDVSGQLQQMGVNVLDQEGNLRDMGTVIEEVAAKWGTWTDAQQQAAAVAIAGKRQYNNLIALFENWNMYESSMMTSQGAKGTLQKQQDIYTESIEYSLKRLTTASEAFYDALIDNDSMIKFIDFLTDVVDGFSFITDSLGGLMPMLGALMPLVTNSLGKNLGTFFADQNRMRKNAIYNKQELEEQAKQNLEYQNIKDLSPEERKLVELESQRLKYASVMSPEELNQAQERISALGEEVALLKEKQKIIQDTIGDQEKDPTIAIQTETNSQIEQLKRKRDRMADLQNQDPSLLEAEKELNALQNSRNALNSWRRGSKRGSIQGASAHGISGLTKNSSQKEINAAVKQRDKEYREQIKAQEEKIIQIRESLQSKIDEQERKIQILEQESLQDFKDVSSEDRIQFARADAESLKGIAGQARSIAVDVETSPKGLKEEWAKINAEIAKSSNLMPEVKIAADNIEKELQELNKKGVKPTEEQLKKLQARIQGIANSCENSGDTLKEYANDLEQMTQEADELSGKIANGAESFEEEYDRAIAKTTQTITNAVGALASLASAISMLQNVGNIWSNEDLTVGEKILQTLPIITSLVMMSIPAMEAVSVAHKKHVAEYIAGEGAKQAANIKTAATARVSLGPYIAIAAAIVGIVAAVALITGSVKKGESDLEKAQKAAENAAEAADAARNRVSELKNAYNELENDIADYSNAKNAIDQMKKGTEEWKDAVQNLNLQVLDLISKYPELINYLDTSGEIFTISQEGFDVAKKAAKQRIFDSQNATYIANIAAAEANKKLIRQNSIQQSAEKGFGQATNKDPSQETLVLGTKFDLETSTMADANTDDQKKFVAYRDLGLIDYAEKNGSDLQVDYSKIQDFSPEKLLELENKLSENDYGDEIEKNISSAIEEVKKSNELTAEQNELIDLNTDALKNSIAGEKGYDVELFNSITKNISIKDYEQKLDIGKIEKANTNSSQVGKNVDTKNQSVSAATEINKQLEKAFSGTGLTFTKVVSKDLLGWRTDELGSFIITVDGALMSIDAALNLASAKKMEKAFEDSAGALDKYKEKEQNQNAYRFREGKDQGYGNLSNWEGATFKDFNELESYTEYGDDYLEAVAISKNSFVKLFEDAGLDPELLQNFTAADRKTFTEKKWAAKSAGYEDNLNEILNQYTGDPEKYEAVARAAIAVNWDDTNAIAKFMLNYAKDYQESVRKREFDYFKNINSELDKLNAKLETTIGLEKQNLLERQIALEKEANERAKLEKESAWHQLKAEQRANNESDKYFYEDGSLNITAVYDQMATIEDKESDEYQYLEGLLATWDYVVDKEQTYLETINKVIDAQIEAFNYAYEVQKQINETLRQWRDFSREFKDDISDFDKSAGIAAADAAFAQISDGQLDFALAEDKLSNFRHIADFSIPEEVKNKILEDIGKKYVRNDVIEAISTESIFTFNPGLMNSPFDYDTPINLSIPAGAFSSTPLMSFRKEDNRQKVTSEEYQKIIDEEIKAETEKYYKNPEFNPFYNVDSDTFNSAAFFEVYQTEISSAITALESAQAGIEALYESYLSIQDEILETYDKEIEKLSKINSILKGSADLAKMAGVDSSDFYSQMSTNSGSSFAIAQAQLADIQTQYAGLFDEKGNLIDSKETADKVRDNLAAAGENVLSTAQEYYSSIAEQFSYELQALFDNAAGGNLAGKAEAWELAVVQDQRYLDNVNEAYARGELDRRFKQSLEETDNISAQNKLLEAQRKIEAQLTAAREAQGKLRQADLDRANAEYDLALKKIALEEAQQASNKMQLTRDASGNYSYQFVADQDAISKAEEELAAAENNLYNMDKERTQSLVSEYYSTMSEANSQIAEAMAANDQERVERLKDYYFGNNGLLKGIQSELGIATTGLNAMTGVYKDFTDSVLATDIGELGTNVGTAIATSASTMSELSSTINTLLGDEGALSSLPVTLENAVIKAVDTSELTAKATDIVTQLPGLIEAVNTLKITLGGADGTGGYIQAFKDWVNDNQPASTDAQLKNNVQGIYDVVSNGMTLKAIDADNDGFLDSFELKANDTSGEN